MREIKIRSRKNNEDWSRKMRGGGREWKGGGGEGRREISRWNPLPIPTYVRCRTIVWSIIRRKECRDREDAYEKISHRKVENGRNEERKRRGCNWEWVGEGTGGRGICEDSNRSDRHLKSENSHLMRYIWSETWEWNESAWREKRCVVERQIGMGRVRRIKKQLLEIFWERRGRKEAYDWHEWTILGRGERGRVEREVIINS